MNPNPTRKLGLLILFICELIDRFSYYGMRAIIVLFAVSEDGLALSIDDALHYYGLLTMAVFIAPLPLGILVDFLLKHIRGVEIGGAIATIGYWLLSVSTDDMVGIFGGLVFITIGVGLLKPSLTVLVGRLFHKTDQKRDAAYILFYFGVNIGAFLSAILISSASERFGWDVGFRIIAMVMTIGTSVFLFGKRFIHQIELEEDKIDINELDFSTEREDHLKQTQTTISRSFMALGMILFASLFWVGFELSSSVSISAISDLYEKGVSYTISLYDIELPASSIQNVNGVLMFFFAPLMILYIMTGKAINTVVKVGLAFLIFAFSLCLLLPITNADPTPDRVFELLMLSTVFATIAELFISPIALSYITRLSSTKFTSTAIGIYFLTVGMFNNVAGRLGEFTQTMDQEQLLNGLIISLSTIGLLLLLIKKRLTKLTGGIE